MGQCFLDWATAVVGEADRELACVTLTYHSSGPSYETLAQCKKSPGTYRILIYVRIEKLMLFHVVSAWKACYLRYSDVRVNG